MRVAELGNRYDPAGCEGLSRRQRTEARPAVAAVTARPEPYPGPNPGPYPESHPGRGGELRAEPRHQGLRGTRAGERRRTGFEPFLIAAVLGLFLWALILTPFFI